jgi:hypothetical protein
LKKGFEGTEVERERERKKEKGAVFRLSFWPWQIFPANFPALANFRRFWHYKTRPSSMTEWPVEPKITL